MSTQVSRLRLAPLDRQSDRSLYRQISDALATVIKDGWIDFGEKLPSETELVKHYGVARTTIRLALSELRTAGLVRAEQGRGVFADFSHEPKKETDLPGVFRSAAGPSHSDSYLLRVMTSGHGELHRILPPRWDLTAETTQQVGEIQDARGPSDFWPHYSWKVVGDLEWRGYDRDIRDWREAADALIEDALTEKRLT